MPTTKLADDLHVDMVPCLQFYVPQVLMDDANVKLWMCSHGMLDWHHDVLVWASVDGGSHPPESSGAAPAALWELVETARNRFGYDECWVLIKWP